ncbi:MAG: chemotaxis protein CheR [Chlorobiaceae bacterium]|nr:chemotaxis protein CheR [Chlorobiaceae bacterium]MBA4310930.1 chemotaxis protein CheR [Chlorobiaceae bacterium]
MKSEEFSSWRQFIYDKTGIYFQDNKKYLLESRLLKRINFLNLSTYDEYLKYVKYNSNGRKEETFLYEVITINETFFFRNQPQLDVLVTNIFPEVISIKEKLGKNKIRIWSAASSSGEEAYSIAMVINDLVKPKYPNIEFEIVGTDISQKVIDTAKKGIYKEYSVRNMPSYYFKKYFQQTSEGFVINQALKKNVSFRLLNLNDENEMKQMSNFDVIFCANVLIYFDTNSKVKVVNSLYNALNKSGVLFIGYSETLQNITKSFKVLSFPKTVSYKKE